MTLSNPLDPPRPMPQRTSEVLLDFARTFPGERVRLGDLDQLLADRAFGFLLLIFALPNTLPLVIPGLSTVTGIPLGLIALQMMLGMQKPYLPRWLADRSLPRSHFLQLVEKAAPWLRRIERLMRPRWAILQTSYIERFLGGFCLLLAVVLMLPIPFSNIPPAIGLVLISLGLIEKDGVLMSAGFAIGVAALTLAGGVLWAMTQAAILFLRHLLSG